MPDITSLISVPMTVVNVPDPISVSARFIYNFYVKDEDRSFTPQPTTPIDYNEGIIDIETVDIIETKERGALTARVPRYNLITISPQTFTSDDDPANPGIRAIERGDLSPAEVQFIKNSEPGRTNYNVEGTVSNQFMAQSVFSDIGVKSRLQAELYRISSFLIENGDALGFTSDFDIAMALNDLTPPDIDASSILDALADTSDQGIDFVNEIKEKPYSRVDSKASLSYPVKQNAEWYRNSTRRRAQANPFGKYFISDLLGGFAPASMRNNLLNSALFPSFGSITQTEVDEMLPNIIAETLDPEPRVAESILEIANSQFPVVEHVGFIVEKSSRAPDGTLQQFPDFISTNPNSSEFIDPNVKYGHTYFYKARQLYRVRLAQVEDIRPDGRVEYRTYTSFIASRTPTPAVVTAEETTPPKPPSTLLGSFVYKVGNGLRLEWARPSNPTQDIKKYQVFRRKGINEPFQLIAQYDFSDPGYTMDRQQEAIDDSLVHKIDAPRNYHVDYDFSRESTYIYCIASVDAHGFVSNYGTQMQFSFDRFSNELRVKKLSRSGAPRSYPNYYVDPTELEEFGSDRLVEDVIKDSGHSTMRIYFDPTAYRYANESDGTRSDPIVLGKSRGNYKLQIVNLDRQVSRDLTIEIAGENNLPDLL